MENEGSELGQVIIMVGFWGSVLVYPILQFIAIRKTVGIWRIFAFMPLLLMLFIFSVTVIGFYQESNLWPLMLIFTSPLVIVYLVLFIISHLIFLKRNSKRQ